MVRFLAGDIGGTNSRFHLMELKSSKNDPSIVDEVLIAEEVYPSQQYSSLTFIIQKFLSKYIPNGPFNGSDPPDENHSKATNPDYPIACCLAVAGPVRANKSEITNVNWSLDGDQMANELYMRHIQIINDFVGIGYGLLALTRNDVIPINDVPAISDAPKACLGAGTGLGETFLTWNGTEYDVWPSEGGHVDYAPRDETEFKLLEYFKNNERVPRVSIERICSGLGIPRIYDFFAHTHPEEVNAEVTRRLRIEDEGAVIAEFAQNGKCHLCRRSIELFVKLYGAECGNYALKVLPFGGMYIAGGIAPKLLWAIQHDHLFYQHYLAKGRMRGLLEQIPVYIVTHPQVGLLGAKVVCKRLLRKEGFSIKGELTGFSEAVPKQMLTPAINLDDLETEINYGNSKPEIVTVRRRQKGLTANPSSLSLDGLDKSPANLMTLPSPTGKYEREVSYRSDAGRRASAMSTANYPHLTHHLSLQQNQPAAAVSEGAVMRAAVIGGLVAATATLLLSQVIRVFERSRT